MVDKLKRFSIKSNLSLQILLLTISFVLLAEVFIFVPSIINFRLTWLEERLTAANIAILAIEAAPDHMVSEMLTKKLLDNAQMVAISLKHKGKRQLILNTDQPLNIAARYDLRKRSYWGMMQDTLKIMFHAAPHGSLIQVTGYTNFTTPSDDSFIEIIFPEDLLCEDMHRYSVNVMLLSIIISLITAGLVYFSLSCLLIRPVKRMTKSIIDFRDSPEIATNGLPEEGRRDEIGIIMGELGKMQNEIRKALIQKKHLAELGEGVSKINHDLRNILSSALMVTDHLSRIDDPIVQKLTPRFVTAVDRAIRLCENTLKYGKSHTEKPNLSLISLHQIIEEVALSLGLSDLSEITFHNDVPEDLLLNVDGDHIFRVFLNLCRNALQAMKQRGDITITATRAINNHTGINNHIGLNNHIESTIIDIIDNGPGIPDQIKKTLFQPFHNSANGGAGLGLAISKELLEAHGGSLALIESQENGTHFRIILSS